MVLPPLWLTVTEPWSVACPDHWVYPVPGTSPQDQLPNWGSAQAAVWEWLALAVAAVPSPLGQEGETGTVRVAFL